MKVTFFTGAGISANAGIPVYRAEGSSWTDSDLEKKSHSHSYGNHLPELWDKHWGPLSLQIRQTGPTYTHKRIAEAYPDAVVITQNVDDLHERAGSDTIHLHGTLAGYCMRCKSNEVARYQMMMGAPVCYNCGSNKTRPAAVLFGESIPRKLYNNANKIVMESDVLVVIGSSLVVYPATAIVMDAIMRKQNVIIVNKSETSFDKFANIALHDDCDSVIDNIL